MKISARRHLKHSLKQKIRRNKPQLKRPRKEREKTPIETENVNNEHKSLSHLYIKTQDNSEVLPGYNKVLKHVAEEEISINDLDQLQHDLEKLLTVCAIRRRALCSDFQVFNKTEERPQKKHRVIEEPTSPSSLKIRKVVEKKIKRKPGRPFKNFSPDGKNIQRFLIPKNDIKSKFWFSVEPHCGSITKDDVIFLDDLTQECNMEIDKKIPSLGPHYTLKWKSDTIKELFKDGRHKPKLSKETLLSILSDENINDALKNDASLLSLSSALIEESENDEKIENLKILNTNINTKVCFEKRTRKELEELDILNSLKSDSKTLSDDDQILDEIKKCQKELITVNTHNRTELNKLHYLIDKNLIHQELNEKLNEVDDHIKDVYTKLSSSNEQNKTDLEWEAVNLIQLQRKLHKEVTEMGAVE